MVMLHHHHLGNLFVVHGYISIALRSLQIICGYFMKLQRLNKVQV